MHNWELAGKIFIYGFTGVFLCLAILMFSVQICGGILKRLKKKT
jgi:Na+-transporting methylmalonyl-CoA/oxaloacetate decarboxylase gamma subunit